MYFFSCTDYSSVYMSSPSCPFYSLTQILPAFTWEPHQVLFSLSHTDSSGIYMSSPSGHFSLSHRFFRHLYKLPIRSFFLSHAGSSGIYMSSLSGHFISRTVSSNIYMSSLSGPFLSHTQILPAFTWAPYQVRFSLTQILPAFTWAQIRSFFSLPHTDSSCIYISSSSSHFSLSHRLLWHFHELPFRPFSLSPTYSSGNYMSSPTGPFLSHTDSSGIYMSSPSNLKPSSMLFCLVKTIWNQQNHETE